MIRALLNRFVPHDGDFGLSSWTSCSAPCCPELHSGAGWFAIKTGEVNYVDPTTNQHVHADCFALMCQRTEIAEDTFRRAVTNYFQKTGTV